jgi:flagellar basal body-associated protein FliL
MASKDDQKKKGLPTGVIVVIVLIVLALLGGLGWYLYSTRGANANTRINSGTPAPGGQAAVPSMPSLNNVSAGNGNGAGNVGGRVGAQV